MTDPILLIQTAFAGDLVLTIPLIDDIAERYPDAPIDVLCIPSTVALLAGHPRIRHRIGYDKRRQQPSLLSLMRSLARERYGLCISPHRSLRSALLAWATRAPRRITFDRSAGRLMFTDTVPYRDDLHEVERNRSLLAAEGASQPPLRRPRLFPTAEDHSAATRFFSSEHGQRNLVCIAPGSVWATKRWREEGFAEVAAQLGRIFRVVLVGGAEDRMLCERIRIAATTSGRDIAASDRDAGASDRDAGASGRDAGASGRDAGASGRDAGASDRDAGGIPDVINAAGELGFLASASLIGRATVLISNDSAPVHLASAMGTPVVEIYGATVPAFGFSPYGVPHRIVQLEGLDCRPCAIHGGPRCPLGTFACMRDLDAEQVISAAEDLIHLASGHSDV
ncbi:MAG: glycosyltransferase family 9 protein [Bacteroidetes bacterium]|nr:glycosyltransferase family 9 protein [Bacteroidota bacterium]